MKNRRENRHVKAPPLVVGIGEVLWDKFPDGARLGGAPANFSFHAAQLGARAQLVSRLGSDDDGAKLLAELRRKKIAPDFVQTDLSHPTGTVFVSLARGQPTYEIRKSVAWDFLEWSENLSALAAKCDAVCFGTLAQRSARSRTTIRRFVRATHGLRLCDLNLRQSFYDRAVLRFGLENATALKLNRGELETLAKIFRWKNPVEKILADFPIRVVVAVTRGAAGCDIFTPNETVHIPSPKIKCVDAVGAGDAFAAALTIGLLRRLALADIAALANRAGGFVASRAGAMPKLPPDFGGDW